MARQKPKRLSTRKLSPVGLKKPHLFNLASEVLAQEQGGFGIGSIPRDRTLSGAEISATSPAISLIHGWLEPVGVLQHRLQLPLGGFQK